MEKGKESFKQQEQWVTPRRVEALSGFLLLHSLRVPGISFYFTPSAHLLLNIGIPGKETEIKFVLL